MASTYPPRQRTRPLHRQRWHGRGPCVSAERELVASFRECRDYAPWPCGRQARQRGAIRSERCVARRDRAWDGMRVITVYFARALPKCAGHANMRFLLILQQVLEIGKTRNQFLLIFGYTCISFSHTSHFTADFWRVLT